MKLGKRLQHIESLVSTGYNHIWDCCCDHGLLGSALLSRSAAPHIHFVDIVPDLMHTLENKLQRFHTNSPSTWYVHCLDVSALPLDKYEGRHLVIIAGVGGDLMTQFIHTLHQRHAHSPVDFLLCPVHHQYTLRQQLIQLDFSLKKEILVEENQRFYEILLVSSPSNADDKAININPVGEMIWQANTAEQSNVAVNYLNTTLSHLKRMQRNKSNDIQHIIEAYSSVHIGSSTLPETKFFPLTSGNTQ